MRSIAKQCRAANANVLIEGTDPSAQTQCRDAVITLTAATVGGAPNSDELYGNAMESLNEGETLDDALVAFLGVEPIAPRWLLESSRMLDDFSQVFERIGGIPKRKKKRSYNNRQSDCTRRNRVSASQDLREALRVDKINDEEKSAEKFEL